MSFFWLVGIIGDSFSLYVNRLRKPMQYIRIYFIDFPTFSGSLGPVKYLHYFFMTQCNFYWLFIFPKITKIYNSIGPISQH